MAMTAQQELALLEQVYQDWLTAGCPQEISANGRSYTKAAMERTVIPRMDALRLAVYRSSGGGIAQVVRFRNPE